MGCNVGCFVLIPLTFVQHNQRDWFSELVHLHFLVKSLGAHHSFAGLSEFFKRTCEDLVIRQWRHADRLPKRPLPGIGHEYVAGILTFLDEADRDANIEFASVDMGWYFDGIGPR